MTASFSHRELPYLRVATLGLQGVHGEHGVARDVQGNLALTIFTVVIPDLEVINKHQATIISVVKGTKLTTFINHTKKNDENMESLNLPFFLLSA